MKTDPYWNPALLPRFESISSDLQVDVVVIGAGLTGVTTAYLLKKEGVRVALLDRHRAAGGDTGRTTAHLTCVTDKRLTDLVRDFGKDAAKAYWEGGLSAIDTIASIVKAENIECDFKWVTGYLHASIKEDSHETKELEKEAVLAKELGFDAEFIDRVPYANRHGIRWKNQAKFNPMKYLAPLLNHVHGDGSYVLEETEAEKVDTDPLTVHAKSFKITCKYLVIATHNPILGRSSIASGTLFQTKLSLYTSYVLGASLPKGELPEALFWDTSDPYYYLRVDRREQDDYIIFGGEDCKTGQETDGSAIFTSLERKLHSLLPKATVQNRWLGQVVETNDGLPFIGENEEEQFIGTGFCGNGFTLGTLSATMAVDRYFKEKIPGLISSP